MMRRIAALAGLLTVVACSGPAPVQSTPVPSTPVQSVPPGATATTRVTASPAPRPRPVPPRVTVTRTRMKDGSVVTLAAFAGPVTYVLHDGSEDPGLAAGRVRAGPAVRGGERRQLLAAFNGGFKLSAGAGGYEQEGHVAVALRRGVTSLVIDRSGRARIGGHGVPAPGEAVYSVRQNLPPLVLGGRPTAGAADWGLWGATLGGGEYVARSALGQDAAGHLVYAASMSASPADLAVAMARAGVRIAMELDINPEWVQLDVASRPGGPLRAALRGQNRPADQFLLGWARDFIAVLAPAGAGG
jgi:Phosphodiester glycosidase